jgi:hypothetical protein
MQKQQKKVLTILIVIAVFYFLIFIPPNSVGADDENMLSVFEIDEYALYNYNVRMIEGEDTIKASVWKFITYQHYNYGFPSHFVSVIVILPLKILGPNYYTTPNIMLVSRQIVSILPMLLAVLILVYLQTRFYSLWKSLFLFLFLLSIPAVFRNNMWLHPESLTILFIVLTIFFLDRDNLSFERNFYYASIACGIAAGTKMLGLFFFITIPTYIAWGYFSKRISVKTALIRSITFVSIMFVVFLICNPMLFFPGPREAAIKMQLKLSESISRGLTVEYEKGPLPWFKVITKYYGEAFTIILIFAILVIGVVRGPRRLLNTLIFTWVVPISLYILFIIVIRPFHFFLPIALPLYSSIGILLWPFTNHKSEQENQRVSQAVKGLSIIALLVIGYQFILNVKWDIEEYDLQLNREELSPRLKFYDSVELECLEPVPNDIYLIITRDRSIYVPVSGQWSSQVTRSLVDYEYVQENNFHLILLSQQRIKDYTQPDSLENAIDKTEMIAAHEFFADAVSHDVEGYELCYEDDLGFAYVRDDLYQKYFNK